MSPALNSLFALGLIILIFVAIWRSTIAQRIAIYAVLTLFAFVMIFPFLYMMSTSFKQSSDVFHVPPRILPYSSVTTEYNGKSVPVYRFVIDGQERQLVPSGQKKLFGFFTTPELINPDQPRESEITLRYPLAEAVETTEVITKQKADGTSVDFTVYEVTVDGETQKLLLARQSNLDEFIDPNDTSIAEYAVARTAELQEVVEFRIGNYRDVLGLNPEINLNLNRALVNTTLVTVLVVAGQLVTSLFGGYAFSRIEFKGRNTLFLLYLGSIMIPFVVLIIPMYRLMVALGWQNQIVSLIVPWIFTAYGTFLIRQFFISIPKEIEEAALLDGASRFRILWTIFVPLSTPAIATLAIFSFLYAWNSFLWPLLIIGEGNTNNHVLTLSLIRLSNSYADQPNFVLTGAAIAILPPVIVFIFAQRYFIESVSSTAVKG